MAAAAGAFDEAPPRCANNELQAAIGALFAGEVPQLPGELAQVSAAVELVKASLSHTATPEELTAFLIYQHKALAFVERQQDPAADEPAWFRQWRQGPFQALRDDVTSLRDDVTSLKAAHSNSVSRSFNSMNQASDSMRRIKKQVPWTAALPAGLAGLSRAERRSLHRDRIPGVAVGDVPEDVPSPLNHASISRMTNVNALRVLLQYNSPELLDGLEDLDLDQEDGVLQRRLARFFTTPGLE